MFRTRWALATLLAACLLGGCSDDDPEPNIDSDPTSSSPTTSESVSTSPTVTPTELLGPEPTVEAWVGDWNDALDSGDTTRLRAYEEKGCRGCDELVGPVEAIVAAGGSFEGGDWTVASLRALSETDAEAKVSLGVDVAAGSTVAEAGAEATVYPATKHLLTFTLEKTEAAWKISVIEVLS